jgi:NAD(P)-dependent dehydrogenase (short-subunit alcohol dehydrogenase family)
MRVFVAGASGALGRRLVPLLVAGGHDVVGTTGKADKLATLSDRRRRSLDDDARARIIQCESKAGVGMAAVVRELAGWIQARPERGGVSEKQNGSGIPCIPKPFSTRWHPQGGIRAKFASVTHRVTLTDFNTLTSAIAHPCRNLFASIDLSRLSRPSPHVDICDEAFVVRRTTK